SDLGLAPAGRRDHFTQQFAGMRRAPVRIALGGIFGHGFGSSAALLDAESISAGSTCAAAGARSSRPAGRRPPPSDLLAQRFDRDRFPAPGASDHRPESL